MDRTPSFSLLVPNEFDSRTKKLSTQTSKDSMQTSSFQTSRFNSISISRNNSDVDPTPLIFDVDDGNNADVDSQNLSDSFDDCVSGDEEEVLGGDKSIDEKSLIPPVCINVTEATPVKQKENATISNEVDLALDLSLKLKIDEKSFRPASLILERKRNLGSSKSCDSIERISDRVPSVAQRSENLGL